MEGVATRKGWFGQLVAGAWLDAVIVLLALLAFFATPLQMLRFAGFFPETVNVAIACAVLIAISAFVIYFRHPLSDRLQSVAHAIAGQPLWMIIAAGGALRIGWVLLFPSSPGSDGQIYLGLAQNLSQGGPYVTSSTYAYWPPGYPLFLAPLFTVFDNVRLVVTGSNIVLFVLSALGVARLCSVLGSPRAGKVAALLIAIWPNLITSSGTPEKELLVVALLPWAMALILQSLADHARIWPALAAGALLGAAILVQPSLQFLPLVGALLYLGFTRPLHRALVMSVALIVSAAAVVAPWTIRNYEVFGEFVLVTSNGGYNLYRANNPLATGGYTPRGEVDLSGLPELERDRQAKQLAVQWIKENPRDFTSLSVEKMIRFMGDDAVGLYTTFRVGDAKIDERAYGVLKAGANAWWVVAWAMLALFVITRGRTHIQGVTMLRAPLWLWLYLFALHSIFESAGKYHVPVLWVLCVLIALYAMENRSEWSPDNASPSG